MTETQIVWIKQLKKGNELAALNLYNDFSKAMYNTLIRITGDTEIAKDLLQEAFIKAFRKIESLEEPKAFGGWLKRIVINAGLEYTRRNHTYFDTIEKIEESESDEVNENLIDDTMLHAAIKNLPDGCRTVLTLHLLEGMKHSEIAEELSISESTSKTQYRHAKKLLKEKLQHHYEN